jgi:hypothetical protein
MMKDFKKAYLQMVSESKYEEHMYQPATADMQELEHHEQAREFTDLLKYLHQWDHDRQLKIENLKQQMAEKEEEDSKECSFHPQIISRVEGDQIRTLE